MRAAAATALAAGLAAACIPAANPPALIDAPDAAFRAIEPTELGVIAAPALWDVAAPVYRGFPEGLEGTQSADLHVRRREGGYRIDVIQEGLLDDAIAARHVRLDLRREPDGWYPTNAYIRQRCARAADPAAWSPEPCA